MFYPWVYIRAKLINIVAADSVFPVKIDKLFVNADVFSALNILEYRMIGHKT